MESSGQWGSHAFARVQSSRFGGGHDRLGETLSFGFRGRSAVISAGISPVPVA